MVILKATGVVGSILALIAVVILFFKTLIAFIAFLTGAIKIAIVLLFVVLFLAVGFLVLRGLVNARKKKE